MLAKAHQQINRKFRQEIEKISGLTPTQFAVLSCLWEKDGQTISEIAERLKIDSATMTGLVDRLEKRDLIERHRSPKDRRITILNLTCQGWELELPLRTLVESLNQEMMNRIGYERMELLKEILDQFNDL